MTPAQKQLIALDLQKAQVDAYYEALEAALAQVRDEVGLGGFFEAADGTVYQIIKPEGRFVRFADLGYLRTKRAGERAGSLSKEKAEAARAAGLICTGDTPPARPPVTPEAQSLAALRTAHTELLGLLRELDSQLNLGDLTYAVREKEGAGWEGPAVKAWARTVERVRTILKDSAAGPEGGN